MSCVQDVMVVQSTMPSNQPSLYAANQVLPILEMQMRSTTVN